MISKQFVLSLIQDELVDLNILLIDLQVSSSNHIKVLLDSDTGVKISECVKISRAIEHQIDREEQDFELEVSSYGVFSPFKVPLHYNKNLGKEVEIYLVEGKNFKGVLSKIEMSDKNEVKAIEISQKFKKKLEGKKKKVEVEEITKINIEAIKKIKLVPKF